MPTNDDLAEVIARWRSYFSDFTDDDIAQIRGLHVGNLRRILDAAEAGMKARDAALEEAAKVVLDYQSTNMPNEANGLLGLIASDIRALKEKP